MRFIWREVILMVVRSCICFILLAVAFLHSLLGPSRSTVHDVIRYSKPVTIYDTDRDSKKPRTDESWTIFSLQIPIPSYDTILSHISFKSGSLGHRLLAAISLLSWESCSLWVFDCSPFLRPLRTLCGRTMRSSRTYRFQIIRCTQIY